MGQAFLHGNGGANPLNFKVVGGTTQPSNPKENTIWINSSTAVDGWQFAKDDPNLLDFDFWSGIEVANGTKTVTGKTITLTATTSNCFTHCNAVFARSKIPCTPGKTYVFEWDCVGAAGNVHLWPNASEENSIVVSNTVGKIQYTAADDVTLFSIRVGVQNANTTATYSNMRVTEIERAFKPGGAWITTGSSSHVEFNALKKNGICISPMVAKQYIGGAWVSKPAKIYKGDLFVDFWRGELYDSGQMYTGVTGGYSAVGSLLGSDSNAYAPTITNSSSGMRIQTMKNTSGGIVHTTNKIDLTDYKTLTFEGVLYGYETGRRAVLGVWSSIGGNWDTNRVAYVEGSTSASEITKTIDVSGLTGEYYIGIATYSVNYESNQGYAIVKKLYLT